MKLKLKKARSYTGIVKATKANPFVTVDDAAAATLIKSGYFEKVEEESEDDESDEEPDGKDEDTSVEVDYEALSGMTKAQLTEFAAEHEISLSGCTTKAEILAAISTFYGGNETMMELQE